MNTTTRKTLSEKISRRVSTISSLLIVGLATVLTAQPSLANSNNAQHQIEALAVCYGLGSDELAQAPAEDFASREDDPNFKKGRALYRKCMTSNWTIDICFNGEFLFTVNREDWAISVYEDARFNGVLNTQHLLGSFISKMHRHKGTVQAYASINSAFLEPFDGFVQVIRATYVHDVVRRKNGKLKIKHTKLDIKSIHFSGPPA